MSLDREYSVPCSVSDLFTCDLTSLTPWSSFAQYTYGIYLGFNGKPLHDGLLLNSDKPIHIYSVTISRPFRASVVTSTSTLFYLYHLITRA